MIIRPARDEDFAEFLELAAQVEHWFGPMVDDAGFCSAVTRHIGLGTALVAVSAGAEILGGLLFGAHATFYTVHWLVVAKQIRGYGIGRALTADAIRRFVRGPGTLEVITFGADHPGAVASGARAFYESLGFAPAEAADSGPDGGSRQVYRRAV
ncbi:GNAT family N-acetyltransferase [Nocardia sp. NBC_01730]|uniref:GNAT family N-acetyltransferase n=1 Tax=Nocardia sp. NBC_01730 TaxID=2975998 RepID=UPI002E133CCE|nr:GNAT family N-acetyltransferase [Nocardia sp. NBC_01730]